MKLASDDEGNAAWQFATGRRTFRKRGADFERAAERDCLVVAIAVLIAIFGSLSALRTPTDIRKEWCAVRAGVQANLFVT